MNPTLIFLLNPVKPAVLIINIQQVENEYSP